MNRHFFAFGSGPPFTDKLAEKYIELTSGGPIAIILVEREDWQSFMPNYTKQLIASGHDRFSYIPLPTIQEKQAVAEIKKSGGIILCGGETDRYADYIVDTAIGAAIKAVYDQGVPVAGFSAGALISPQQTSISAKDNRENAFVERKGIGLLENIFLAVHFSEWDEESHLQQLAAKHPSSIHYGIDENTGVYFHNGRLATTEGRGVYQMVDGKCRKLPG